MNRAFVQVTIGLLLGQFAALSADAQSAPATDPAPERPSVAGRRIVKHFDFDEQSRGNYEKIPMYWRRHGQPGFPLFLEGRFDRLVGHAAPPCFRLDLDGGSLGYHYEARDISVRTNSDYLLVAWIKTQGLRTARAYVSAYYLDRKGSKIAGTERRCDLIGPEASDWQAVSIGLPGGVPLSRYIGVSIWLTQANMIGAESGGSGSQRTTTQPAHSIDREDVKASAWFDDISVYRLPRVSLQAARAGHVFLEDQPVELQTEVTDPDGLNLSARLSVRDVEGKEIDTRPVAIGSGQEAVQRHKYDRLPVGLYRAELLVSTADTVLVRRSLQFLRVSRLLSPPQAAGRGFGVVLESTDPRAYTAQRELLETLHVGAVKLPVWSPHRAAREPEFLGALDRYLEGVVASGGEPIGVMANDAPDPAEAQDGRPQTMLDVFSNEPAGWRPLIARVWSRYAGLIHTWQLGADGDQLVRDDLRVPDVLRAVRREMTPLMSRPAMATCASAHQPQASTGSEFRSVLLPASLTAVDFEAHLPSQLPTSIPANQAAISTWAVVEPLAAEGYPRELRLTDLAHRLAEAYFCKVGSVFLAAPWDIRAELLSASAAPREDLIIFRTVADVLGGSTPVSRSIIDGQIQCLTFDRDGRAILFAWDPQAPPEGRDYPLYLGGEAESVDLYGRRTRLAPLGQQQIARIGPRPCFIVNAPTWLLEFRRQFTMDPPSLEASLDAHERNVVFRNTHRQPISGILRLTAPPDWDLRPSKLPFALQPGEVFRQAVTIRFPLNAEAGVTPLVGEFDIDADRRYHMLATAWFDLGLAGIDVESYTYRFGDRIVVRQLMTNRTNEILNFDGYLLAPQRQRIDRAFRNFQPGQSMTKDFVLDGASELASQKLRIGLKEVQGTRVWNQVITVP